MNFRVRPIETEIKAKIIFESGNEIEIKIRKLSTK